MDKPTHPENDVSLDDLDLMDDSVEDEVWSEDEDWLDEGENAFPDENADEELKPTKKQKSSTASMLVMMLLIAGGVGGGAYFYTLNNEQSTDVSYPPVVQNVMPEDAQNDVDAQDTKLMTAQPENNTVSAAPNTFGVNPDNIAADVAENNANTQKLPAINSDPDVLTPMPDADAIENTTLAQLEPPALDEEPLSKVVSPFNDDSIASQENDILSPDTLPIDIDAEALNENATVPDASSEGIVPLEEDIMLEKTEIEHNTLPIRPDDKNIATEAINAPLEPVEEVDLAKTLPVTAEMPTQHDSDIGLKDERPEEKNVSATPEPAPEKKKEIPEAEETKVSSKKVEKATPKKLEKPVRKYAAKDWALRSAQSGKAVLYNNRSGETKSVETGYSVSGIGRITSISRINGKWVVKGSLGSISQ